MAIANLSFEELKRSVAGGDLRPVYLLHGREGYYTDSLVKTFESVIPADDRDFALTVVYAPETEPSAVIDICRRLPMMTPRQFVILREAQAVRSDYFEKLSATFPRPRHRQCSLLRRVATTRNAARSSLRPSLPVAA